MSKANSAHHAVVERRVRPIYDWLDNGNNSKALKEAEKVLKKQSDCEVARALSALALVRMGRDAEAQTQIQSLAETAPTDEAVLNAMSIAYREMQQPDKICSLYESATKKDPSNGELLSHLFMSYVRLGEHKKQQQTAMQLYKVKPKNPYYFWAVMSIVLQAHQVKEEDKKKVMFTLAERMIQKMEKEGKMDQEQETNLYLLVLEMQEKFSECLSLLESPLGDRFKEQTSFLHLIEDKRMMYLVKLKRWKDVQVLVKNRLLESPDQWNLYMEYLDSVFNLLESEGDSNPDSALEFIQEQQIKHSRIRGPFLAQIEYGWRMIQRGDNDYKGVLLDHLVSYFSHFGSKPSCILDLRMYLHRLDSQQLEKFFERTKNVGQFDSDGVPSDLPTIAFHTNWHHFHHVTNPCPIDPEILFTLFQRTQTLTATAQHTPTEQRSADGYAIIAAHILWTKWINSKDDELFWRAVVILEYALKRSPANYHMRFLLIRLYNQIGAVGQSLTMISGLELKHIQLDTLGHVITRHLLTCAHYKAAASFYGSTLKFYTGNYKETVDHIISAYRCGSFSQIFEFHNLRDRLSSSLHYAALTVEKMIMDLVTDIETHNGAAFVVSFQEVNPAKDEINWSDLRDNRDFSVLATLHQLDQTQRIKNEVKDTFHKEKLFLKIRSLIVRLISACFHLTNDLTTPSASVTNGQAKLYENDVNQLVQQLQEAKSECLSDVDVSSAYLDVNGPYRPRLLHYLRDDHINTVLTLVKFVGFCHKVCQDEAATDTSSEVISWLEKLVQREEQRFKEEQKSLFHREARFESLTNTIESLSLSCLFLGVCHSMVNRVTTVKKGKKKKEVKPQVNQAISSLTRCVNSAQNCVDNLKDLIEEQETSFVDKLKDLDISEENDECQQIRNEISKAVTDSFSLSFSQFKQVLDKKEAYLATIKV